MKNKSHKRGREFLVTVHGYCQKIPFETAEEARRNHTFYRGNKITGKDKCYPYACPVCGKWHLTSAKRLKHQRKRMK